MNLIELLMNMDPGDPEFECVLVNMGTRCGSE